MTRPSGPIPAGIMIVGEAPGFEEERAGEPFVGSSGRLLTDLLHSVGIMRSSCFITNVCRVRPPYNPKTKQNNDISQWVSDNKKPPNPTWTHRDGLWVHPNIHEGLTLLEKEIALVQPRLVIALGNLPLWATTGSWGVSKWRGSRLSLRGLPGTVVPTYHPAAVLRQLELKPIAQMDLRRAKNIYEGKQAPREYSFLIEPTFAQARQALIQILVWADTAAGDFYLSGDIETRAGMITCLGFSWSPDAAICIPFLTASVEKPFYWSIDEEVELVTLIRRIFKHPKIVHIGQNYLYDCQYYKRHWLVHPRRVFDTMIGHHSLFASLRKGLDFISSMYARDHVYWKDESKDWDPAVGERQLWTYNSKDACITFESAGKIAEMREEIALGEHYDFQQSLFFPVLRMMERGIRIDKEERKRLRKELISAQLSKQELLNYMVGHELNASSPKKVMEFFYSDMGIPGIKSLKTDKLTSDSAALQTVALRQPLLRPVCQTIAELRSIGVFLSTFIEAELDHDGRMRSSFSVAGPVTYRFASYENAFGSGMNFQNLPVAEKQKVKSSDYIKLPNIRKLFIPDPGYEFFDMDLDRADLQVVVWEAEDTPLKQALRLGLDLHCFNAIDIFEIKGIPLEELREDHPNYREHRGRIGEPKRNKAKAGVHATNYGIGARKLAQVLGITIAEAERFISRWLSAHPGIKRWHERTSTSAKQGYIENKFGARLYFFGRFDLPEALGWMPQSTVAGVINRALKNIDAAQQAGQSLIQLQIQVHDSLAGQFPIASREISLQQLRDLSRIVIPYDDPLVIPTGINTSTLSWGHCK
jgi:DNA polymerase I-like protein with 3'-5' exonuclease and polymerase domains/uracil-DNA glycosylase